MQAVLWYTPVPVHKKIFAKQEGTPWGEGEGYVHREERGFGVLERCEEVGGEKGGGHEEEPSSEVLSLLTVLLPWAGKVPLICVRIPALWWTHSI